MANEGRLVGCPFRIDQDRQIAADAERIHVVEEDRALGGQQVLDVVLGGGQQEVDSGLLHEPVQLATVERNSVNGTYCAVLVLHDASPGASNEPASPLAPASRAIPSGAIDRRCYPREPTVYRAFRSRAR